MEASYAVSWRSGTDARSGRLELTPDGLAFTNGSTSESVAYSDLRGVHVGRSRADRISGRPTLVLEPELARRASSRSLQSIFRPYSERSGS